MSISKQQSNEITNKSFTELSLKEKLDHMQSLFAEPGKLDEIYKDKWDIFINHFSGSTLEEHAPVVIELSNCAWFMGKIPIGDIDYFNRKLRLCKLYVNNPFEGLD